MVGGERARPRVLITGADGVIGRALLAALGHDHDIVALTHRPASFRSTVVDIADLDAIQPAFEGVDAVVHLAANASVRADWDSILSANIIGVRNVLEASRRAGVETVVFASTNHVVGMYQVDGSPWLDDPRTPTRLSVDVPIRPDSLYGASKAWGEAVGRLYAERHGLRVICLRIGWVTADDRPDLPANADPLTEGRLRGIWLSQRDCVDLVRAALGAPADVRFAVVYGVSDNPGSWLSLEEAKAVLGWWPKDSELGR